MSDIAIVEGVRTPFIKSWTDFEDIPAQECPDDTCDAEYRAYRAHDPKSGQKPVPRT